MDNDLATAVLARVAAIERELTRRPAVRKGVVTAIAPLSVALGGSPTSYTVVSHLDSYDPRVGDAVSALMYGNALVVIGSLNGGNDATAPRVRAVASAGISVATNTWAAIPFAAADTEDTNAFHNPASNNTRLTVPATLAGVYIATAMISFPFAGSARRAAGFTVNGASTPSTYVMLPGTSNDTRLLVTDWLTLNAGDYVEVKAQHAEATSQTLADTGDTFGMARVGAL